MVTFQDPIQNIELSYHIDPKLIPKWDAVRKNLIKEDSDRVYLIDGRERVGKSLFTFQQAKYIDRSFCLDRICFTPEEFLKCLRTAKPGQVVVFDEAFRGLSSKASQSKVNKAIVQSLMEVGQRNLVVFIVLPTFFLLEIYAAVLRSNCLFHIHKSKNERNKKRSFRIYNYSQKSLLWNVGRKKGFSYKFPRVKVRGYFYKKWPIDEKTYRKKKQLSFGSLEIDKREDTNERFKKFHHTFGIMYYQMKKMNPKLTKVELYRQYVSGGGTFGWVSFRDSIRDYEKWKKEKGEDLIAPFMKPRQEDLIKLYPKKVIKQMKAMEDDGVPMEIPN